MVEEGHEPTMEEKEGLFRNEEPTAEETIIHSGIKWNVVKSSVFCLHEWMPVESFDLPAAEGYKRNISKIYCPKCKTMEEVEYGKQDVEVVG